MALIIGETGCEVYENSLYYLCNFSVNVNWPKIKKGYLKNDFLRDLTSSLSDKDIYYMHFLPIL